MFIVILHLMLGDMKLSEYHSFHEYSKFSCGYQGYSALTIHTMQTCYAGS